MRKTSILLLLLISSVLTACTTDVVEKNIIANEEMDNTDSILGFLDLISQKSIELTIDDTINNSYTLEYPLYKDDLPSMYHETPHMTTKSQSWENLLNIVDIMREDIAKLESYEEDTWREVTNKQNQRICQYRLFINEFELYYQYYYIGDQENILGTHGYVSLEGYDLQYTVHTLEYFYNDDQFSKGMYSSFIEGNYLLEKTVHLRENNSPEITYEKYDFVSNTYVNIDLYDSSDVPFFRNISYYDPIDNIYLSYQERLGIQRSINLIQYDTSNRLVFDIERSNSYFNFDFNLLYVGGWDRINHVGSTSWLYTTQNTIITVPGNVFIQADSSATIHMLGYLNTGDPTTTFDKLSEDLTLPFYWVSLHEHEIQAKIHGEELYDELIDAGELDTDNIINNSFSLLFEEEFYGMSKDLID